MAVTAAPDAISVKPHVLTPDGPSGGAQIIASYADAGGSPLEVKIILFQLGHAIGVGVYPTDRNGTVLRWDHGPADDPSVIHWNAPHCADDQCGSPCGHEG
jgi:hypothetical protein